MKEADGLILVVAFGVIAILCIALLVGTIGDN